MRGVVAKPLGGEFKHWMRKTLHDQSREKKEKKKKEPRQIRGDRVGTSVKRDFWRNHHKILHEKKKERGKPLKKG